MAEQVVYVKASTERFAAYKHFTAIIQKDGEFSVRKIPCGREAKAHISNMLRNRQLIEQSIITPLYLQVAPCEILENGVAEFPYYHLETLQDKLERTEPDQYIALVSEFRERLVTGVSCCEFVDSEEFHHFFGEHGLSDGCVALSVGNVDMVFSNIFVDHDKYILTDYEWVLPFPVPVDYVIYRSLLIDPALTQFSQNEQKRIWERLGFSESMKKVYRSMEVEFQSHICGNDHSLDKFVNPKVKNHCDDLSALLKYKHQYMQGAQNMPVNTVTGYSGDGNLRMRLKRVVRKLYHRYRNSGN